MLDSAVPTFAPLEQLAADQLVSLIWGREQASVQKLRVCPDISPHKPRMVDHIHPPISPRPFKISCMHMQVISSERGSCSLVGLYLLSVIKGGSLTFLKSTAIFGKSFAILFLIFSSLSKRVGSLFSPFWPRPNNRDAS